MESLNSNVARWAPLINSEIERGAYPFPPALILSIVDLESNGIPGAVNPKSGASGLMQIMPNTLKGYNANNPTIELSDLRSGKYPAEQIRVGLWVLGRYWIQAYRYLQPRLGFVPVDQLTRVADLFYAAGPGRAIPMLNKLPSRTFEQFAARYPESNMTAHASRVWRVTNDQNPTWNLDAIEKYVSGSAIDKKPIIAGPSPIAGFAIAAMIIAAVFYFFLKDKTK